MKRLGWMSASAVLLLAAAAPAQVYLLPAPGFSLDYARVRRNSVLRVSINPGYYAAYPGPFFGPTPFLAPPFVSHSFTQIVVRQPPIIIPPPAPPFFFPPLPPPPEELPDVLTDADFARRRVAEQPMPGREAGAFKPLNPDNRDKANQAVPPAVEKKEEAKPEPMPERLLPPPPVKLDPRLEAMRQLELGKIAFARQEYGRALERFRQSIQLAPHEPQGHLLAGHVHLALGNYGRAFDGIQAALRMQPHLITEPFRPLDLYDANVEDYAEHLRAFDEALAATPDDPILQFLSAYLLWFDGRRDEARLLLEKAGPALPDPGLVELFLKALPGGDAL